MKGGRIECHAAGCSRCPNYSVCSKGAKDEYVGRIERNIGEIPCVAVVSGKGGVGKSTVCAMLSSYLSEHMKVCIFDLDVVGSSIPRITGSMSIAIERDGVIHPVKIRENLYAISSRNIPRTVGKMNVVRRILSKTCLRNIDVIVIDTPPGVTEEHLAMYTYLKRAKAVILSTPQRLAIDDVRRHVDFCKKAGFDIIGLVENMSHVVCQCGKVSRPHAFDVKSMCSDAEIEHIGELRVYPDIATEPPKGCSFPPHEHACHIFRKIKDRVFRRAHPG